MPKYFNMNEMTASNTAVRKGIKNLPNKDEQDNLRRLMLIMDIIREEYGAPIIVNSGFRCKELNELIGGAKNSDHLFGCAADIRSCSNSKAENKRLFNTIVMLANGGKIKLRQIIDEHNFSWVHISINSKYNPYKNNQILHI